MTLSAHELTTDQPLPVSHTACYQKQEATFADVLAFVRRQIWRTLYCVQSSVKPDASLILPPQMDHLPEALCYAA